MKSDPLGNDMTVRGSIPPAKTKKRTDRQQTYLTMARRLWFDEMDRMNLSSETAMKEIDRFLSKAKATRANLNEHEL